MSELGRQSLFAYLVEAFNAKGVSLPSRGFFLSAFMPCTSPADVQSAISSRVFGKATGPAGGKPQVLKSAQAPAATVVAPPAGTKGAKPKKAKRGRAKKAK